MHTPTNYTPIAAAVATLLIGGCSHNAAPATSTTTPLAANDTAEVANAPDRTFVSVTGRVVQSDADSFELDYGSGVITVEMDDADWMFEGSPLLADQSVIVHGRIDDDFYERRTIEASSVYAKGLGTHFYASSADEEYFAPFIDDFDFANPRVDMAGEVVAVGDHTFELRTSSGVISVDTALLPYDPLDDEGYQSIEVGDRVRVRGKLDAALFEAQDLTATMVISMRPNVPSS